MQFEESNLSCSEIDFQVDHQLKKFKNAYNAEQRRNRSQVKDLLSKRLFLDFQ